MNIIISLHIASVETELMNFESGQHAANVTISRWTNVKPFFCRTPPHNFCHSHIPQDLFQSKACRLKCKLLLLWHDIMRCANCCGSQADFGCVKGCMTSDKYSGDGSTIVHLQEVKVISSNRGRPQLSRCLDYHVASL